MNEGSSPGVEISPVVGGEKAATEVVVVGAGVGGLATAARLAKAGCRCVGGGSPDGVRMIVFGVAGDGGTLSRCWCSC